MNYRNQALSDVVNSCLSNCNCVSHKAGRKPPLLNHTENKEEVADISHNTMHQIKRISDQLYFFNIFTNQLTAYTIELGANRK